MKITYEVTSIEIDGYLVQYNCGYATTDLDDAVGRRPLAYYRVAQSTN